MPVTAEFQQRLESIEVLIRQIEAAGDPNVRAAARELVQAVMELHGAGLERMVELLRSNGETGQSIFNRIGSDEMASSLLVLYGLHPLSIEERVSQAIEKANRQMRSRNATVELTGMVDGAVHLSLRANGNGPALKEVVEAAVYQAAPDIASLHIDGADEKQGFVPIEMLAGASSAVPIANGQSRGVSESARP